MPVSTEVGLYFIDLELTVATNERTNVELTIGRLPKHKNTK